MPGTTFLRSIAECSPRSYKVQVANHPPNPALDVFLILIGELHQDGTLSDEALAGICEKLELSEYGDIADRIAALPLQNLLFNPKG